jgi:pimeloyl-ACP methyl ester carboxylesterase
MMRSVNGANIAQGLAGDGLPVVFIQGFPLSRKMRSRQVEDVKSLCGTVALDLRGHRESDRPDTPFMTDLLSIKGISHQDGNASLSGEP